MAGDVAAALAGAATACAMCSKATLATESTSDEAGAGWAEGVGWAKGGAFCGAPLLSWYRNWEEIKISMPSRRATNVTTPLHMMIVAPTPCKWVMGNN